MVILIQDENGYDRAVDLSNSGWRAVPVEGNDSALNIVMDGGDSFVINVEIYDRIKSELIASNEVIAAYDAYPSDMPIPG